MTPEERLALEAFLNRLEKQGFVLFREELRRAFESYLANMQEAGTTGREGSSAPAQEGGSMTDQLEELRQDIDDLRYYKQVMRTENGYHLGFGLATEQAWEEYYAAKVALGDAFRSDKCRAIVEEGFGHPLER